MLPLLFDLRFMTRDKLHNHLGCRLFTSWELHVFHGTALPSISTSIINSISMGMITSTSTSISIIITTYIYQSPSGLKLYDGYRDREGGIRDDVE